MYIPPPQSRDFRRRRRRFKFPLPTPPSLPLLLLLLYSSSSSSFSSSSPDTCIVPLHCPSTLLYFTSSLLLLSGCREL